MRHNRLKAWTKKARFLKVIYWNLVASRKQPGRKMDQALRQQHLHQKKTWYRPRIKIYRWKVVKRRVAHSHRVLCLVIHYQKGLASLKGLSWLNNAPKLKLLVLSLSHGLRAWCFVIFRSENDNQPAIDKAKCEVRRTPSFSGPMMLPNRASANSLSAPIKSSGGNEDVHNFLEMIIKNATLSTVMSTLGPEFL